MMVCWQKLAQEISQCAQNLIPHGILIMLLLKWQVDMYKLHTKARCLSDLFYRVLQTRGEYITETTVARGV